MLLIHTHSFPTGSTGSSDTFAVPPSQQPALAPGSKYLRLYSEAIATWGQLEVENSFRILPLSITSSIHSKDSLNIFHNVATPCHSGPTGSTSAFKVACSSSCLVMNAILVIQLITARRANLWHPPKLTVGFSITKLRLKRSGEWVSKPIVLTRKSQLKHVEGSKQSVGRSTRSKICKLKISYGN